MSKIIYEIIEKTAGTGKTESGQITVGNNETLITLYDTIIEDGKSKNIAVVDGEESIYVKDHREQNPTKINARKLSFKGNRFEIQPYDKAFIDYASKSYTFNQNDKGRKQRFRKIEFKKIAEAESNKMLQFREAIDLVNDPKNEERLEAYALVKSITTKDYLNEYGIKAVGGLVLTTINQHKAEKFIEDFTSDFLLRKYKLIQARDKGLFIVDEREKSIKWADGNGVICSTEGNDPIEALATYTMSKSGEKAWQYIKEGVGFKANKAGAAEVSEMKLEDKVSKAIRLDVFSSTAKGYRFNGVLIGGDEIKIVDHFLKNAQKVQELDAALLVADKD